MSKLSKSLSQVSWQLRKTKGVDEWGRGPLFTAPNFKAKKLHYWVGVYGGGKIIGPFFYPIVDGKCIMNGDTHLW